MSKPVILAVDDDPMASAVIPYDLPSHYGADYRVMRAATGLDELTGREVYYGVNASDAASARGRTSASSVRPARRARPLSTCSALPSGWC